MEITHVHGLGFYEVKQIENLVKFDWTLIHHLTHALQDELILFPDYSEH